MNPPPDVPGYRGVPLPPNKPPERSTTPGELPRVGKDELARERAEDAKHEVRAIREEFAEYRKEQAEAFKELRHEILNELKPLQASVEIHDTEIKNIKTGSERSHDMKKTIWGVAGLLAGALVSGYFSYVAAKQNSSQQPAPVASADDEARIQKAAALAVRQYAKERDQRGEPADTIVANTVEFAGPPKPPKPH